jgi:vitamin B12 transporter
MKDRNNITAVWQSGKKAWHFMLVFTLLFSFLSQAQQDSLKHQTLKPVEILGKGEIEKQSGSTLQIDSIRSPLQHNLSLAEKLNTNNILFVKQYGQGTLATPSLRGSNAQQVALIWEGVPIQSSLNGTSDLNLIPAELFEALRIETAVGSSLRGSSAMAGSITFSNPNTAKGTHFKYYHTLSGSGINRGSGIVTSGNSKWNARLGFSTDLSKNNFTYDSSGNNLTQNHAAQRGVNLLPELSFRPNAKHYFYLKSWIHNSKKELPKLLHQQTSQQEQEDEVYRFVGGYKRYGQNSILHVFTSKILEHIRYRDAEQNIDAPSTSDAFYTEINFEKQWNNLLWFVGGSHQYLLGKSLELGSIQTQNRAAAFSSLQFSNDKKNFKSRLHLRQDYYDNQFAPFTPSLQIDYEPFSKVFLSLAGARVFRLPTFNDRFWQPGGNPNLKPESGYTGEASLTLEHSKKFESGNSIRFLLKECIFTRSIDNWIQWEPNGTFWSAHNLDKVWSRGVESNWSIEYHRGKLALLVGGSVNYTLATLPENGSLQENLRGKQLLYTPLYTVLNYLGISISKIHLLFQQQYCGFRYTSSDNFQYLSPYRIYNASISKNIQVSKWNFSTQFSIQNLLDESYQVVAQRPMPGRYYQVQITLQFHQNEN